MGGGDAEGVQDEVGDAAPGLRVAVQHPAAVGQQVHHDVVAAVVVVGPLDVDGPADERHPSGDELVADEADAVRPLGLLAGARRELIGHDDHVDAVQVGQRLLGRVGRADDDVVVRLADQVARQLVALVARLGGHQDRHWLVVSEREALLDRQWLRQVGQHLAAELVGVLPRLAQPDAGNRDMALPLEPVGHGGRHGRSGRAALREGLPDEFRLGVEPLGVVEDQFAKDDLELQPLPAPEDRVAHVAVPGGTRLELACHADVLPGVDGTAGPGAEAQDLAGLGPLERVVGGRLVPVDVEVLHGELLGVAGG